MPEKQPLVSICCITYNHEDYIRDAIEGFLMQKTDFPFEILIHDDASTDRTASIIREYETKFPDLIFPVYQKENQYSKGKKPARIIREIATGKYLAYCEGDDYWTDPGKLQKQVNILESNSEIGLIHTDYLLRIQRTGDISKYPFGKITSGNIYRHLMVRNFIGTSTVCFRRDLLNMIDQEYERENFKIGDLPLWLEISRCTKTFYLNEITSMHRILDKSAMHGSMRKEITLLKEDLRIRRYFLRKYNEGRLSYIKSVLIKVKRLSGIILKHIFQK